MKFLRAITILVASLLTLTASAEKEGDWSRGYYAELSASYYLFSLGSVRADHSVWSMEGDVIQRLSSFGHILLGYWAMSDLTDSGDKSHRSTMYESDPYLFYGYDWEFAEGWRWRNRAGIIWVCNEGYTDDVVHMFKEWTYMGDVKTPWVTIFGQTRVVEGLGTYVRVGAQRAFTIIEDRLTAVPHIAFHGGSGGWNRRRYGDFVEGRRIGPGLGTVEYGVRFYVPLKWGFSWYVDLSGYNAFDERTRTQIRGRRARGSTMKLDAFFAYSGLIWEF